MAGELCAQDAFLQPAARRNTSIIVTRSKTSDQHCLVTSLSTRSVAASCSRHIFTQGFRECYRMLLGSRCRCCCSGPCNQNLIA